MPRKTRVRERVRSTTIRTNAIIGSILAGLAIIGGAVTNMEKIRGFFGARNADSVTAEESSSTMSDSIEVTKVRSIVDQPTSITDFAETAVMSLYWEVVLSNNGNNDSSILDYDVLQISHAGPKSYTGLRQGLYTLKGSQLEPAGLPITIPAGHSTAFFVRLGVLMDKKALSMVKSEFDGAPKPASAIIEFLRSRETDIFGNSFTQQASGASLLPAMDDIREPVFGVTFNTARGEEVHAIISWYVHGLFREHLDEDG